MEVLGTTPFKTRHARSLHNKVMLSVQDTLGLLRHYPICKLLNLKIEEYYHSITQPCYFKLLLTLISYKHRFG